MYNKDNINPESLKESENILEDLNLIFNHLNKIDGKYMCFLKATVVKNNNVDDKAFGYACLDNLNPEEILEVYRTMMKYIRSITKTNKRCKCDKCNKAIEEFKEILGD